MTNFAPSSPIAKSQTKARYFNATGPLAGFAFLIVLAIVVFSASRSPGAVPDAFASTTALP